MIDPDRRTGDTELHAFRGEFRIHAQEEKQEKEQLQQLYDAIFRQEDDTKNISPGLIQMVHRMSDQLEELTATNRRLKTFTGGVVFALSLVWVFVSDVGNKLVTLLHKL